MHGTSGLLPDDALLFPFFDDGFAVGQGLVVPDLVFTAKQVGEHFSRKVLSLGGLPQESGRFVERNHAVEVDVLDAGGDNYLFAADVAQFKTFLNLHIVVYMWGVTT